MGLWEFLRQWRPSRITFGILASILLHLGVVALVLWGGMLVPRPKRDIKKGDALIVELPKPEEPARAGLPSAPETPPSRPSPPAAAPKPPAPAPKAAPAPPEERRVASAPRAPAPTPPAPSPPAPKAAESAPSLPKGTEPAPAEPTPKVAESTPQPAPSGPAAPTRPPAEQQVASVPQGGPPPAPDMRTALRRGAGGTGLQTRGGIEGEAIPLDSADPRYNDYLDQVRKRIKEKWGYPCIVKEGTTRQCEYKSAALEVQFGILKDGRVQFVEVVRNSEYGIYDDYAVNAIKLASPFPPVPAEMMKGMRPGSTGIPISARFIYVVESSLTNLLR